MLVPRAVDPFEKWRNVPLPPVRGESPAVARAEPAPRAAPAARPRVAPQAKTATRPGPKASRNVSHGGKAAKGTAAKPPASADKKSQDAKKQRSGLMRPFVSAKPAPKSAKPARAKASPETAARRQ
jgi:hypothetical protein